MKRWYVRGLPRAEKLTWEVERGQYEPSYSRRSSPRAWAASKLVLVPPAAWTIGKRDRRSLRAALRGAKDPESVASVIASITGTAPELQSSSNRRAAGASGRDARTSTDGGYEHSLVAVNDAARAASSIPFSLPSEGRRYRSSVHPRSGDVAVPADIQAQIDRLADLARKKGKT